MARREGVASQVKVQTAVELILVVSSFKHLCSYLGGEDFSSQNVVHIRKGEEQKISCTKKNMYILRKVRLGVKKHLYSR